MPTITLWDHQRRITDKAIGLIEDGASSILINSPVGSGKTAVGLTLAEYVCQRAGLTHIGWSAMRRNLLKQADKDRVKFGFDVQLTPISMFAKNPPRVDVLIVDEAHHDATNSMNTIHAIAKPRLVIGLSATPKRTDRVGLCFQHTIADVGIQELIDAGVLSQYEHFTIPDWNPITVASTYLREPDRWGQSIVFFHTFAECAAFARALADAGVAVDIVTGQTDRDSQIEAFEQGTTTVLVNMMVLTEGFDSPAIKTAFVRPSDKSPTIQMAGRVLRKHPAIACKQIVQCGRTHEPFPKVARPLLAHKWNQDHWDTVSKAVDLEPILARNRRIMIQAALTERGNQTTFLRKQELKRAQRALRRRTI